MFLLIFIYALIGMQFFSGDLEDSDGNIARYNFNSFGWSLVMIFIIMTSENWNEIMQVVINKHGFGSAFYFVSLIVFGNLMLLNLFLAILLKFIQDNVEDTSPKTKAEIEKADFEEEQELI